MRSSRGQAAVELSLIISVVGIAVIAASATMVPLFRDGVTDLGGDVQDILSNGSVGGGGNGGGDNGGGRSTATRDDVVNTLNTSDEIGENSDTYTAIGPPPNGGNV